VSLRCIVGLGNPGAEYEATRHNVGFLCVDFYAEMKSCAVERRQYEALFGRAAGSGLDLLLVKPQTYMNASGRAVATLLRAQTETLLQPAESDLDLRDELLVISDDLDLPFGKLRFRGRGSAGGHRGVESVIDALGTDLFSRLRIGVGRREVESQDAAEYVLESLTGEERELLKASAQHAAAALPLWVRQGVDACANRYNGTAGELSLEDTES
jgi:PTH1 family peptidyl-tRNA hydrolase